MIELKPCPFCGGKPYLYESKRTDRYGDENTTYVVKCENCFAEIAYPHRIYLIEFWNRRVDNG